MTPPMMQIPNLNLAQLKGLVLNSKKPELKQPKVSFFEAEYSADGMHPRPKKIQGLTIAHVQARAGQLNRYGYIHGELCDTSLITQSH